LAKQQQQQKQPAATTKQQQKIVKKPRKKVSRTVPTGIVRVRATFNNTIVTVTDLAGNVIASASAGTCNFSGSRKSSAFAATVAAQKAAKEAATAYGMKECEVFLNGPGAGRESAVRGVQSSGVIITTVRDTTKVPHNGCRARKRRRV
jgi:small subunit ribosomal protein S11